MESPTLSTRFLAFLQDYSQKVGKDPGVLIEEAVSQAILRHESAGLESTHARLLMPEPSQRDLLEALGEFPVQTAADTPFGEFLERLPDRNWRYQVGRLDEWWFLVVSLEPHDFPAPLELRSVETSQAYCWLFPYSKAVKLWSAPNRFLVVF